MVMSMTSFGGVWGSRAWDALGSWILDRYRLMLVFGAQTSTPVARDSLVEPLVAAGVVVRVVPTLGVLDGLAVHLLEEVALRVDERGVDLLLDVGEHLPEVDGDLAVDDELHGQRPVEELGPDVVALPDEAGGQNPQRDGLDGLVEGREADPGGAGQQELDAVRVVEHHGGGYAFQRHATHELLIAHGVLAVPEVGDLARAVRAVPAHAIQLVQRNPLVRPLGRHHDGAVLGVAVQQAALAVPVLLQALLPHHGLRLLPRHRLAAVEARRIHAVALERVAQVRQLELQRLDLPEHPRALDRRVLRRRHRLHGQVSRRLAPAHAQRACRPLPPLPRPRCRPARRARRQQHQRRGGQHRPR
mmetsp:Transcript_24911/g.77978  ORF Transcript_24911/g.77978 Transcript_24911/m.77978 type:complete len:359 (-) Transcript_24911:150-1226(-)